MISLQENTLIDYKKELRAKAKKTLLSLLTKREDFYSRQQKLIEEIESIAEFKKAKTILIYYPLNDEFDLTSLVISNPDKQWVLPRAIGDSRMLLFEAGELFNLIDCRHGTKAPPATNRLFKAKDLDLVIVPGLMFSKDGYRLGRGGGYYDRLLSLLAKRCKTIGVCLKELSVDKLSIDEHDKAVQKVIEV